MYLINIAGNGFNKKNRLNITNFKKHFKNKYNIIKWIDGFHGEFAFIIDKKDYVLFLLEYKHFKYYIDMKIEPNTKHNFNLITKALGNNYYQPKIKLNTGYMIESDYPGANWLYEAIANDDSTFNDCITLKNTFIFIYWKTKLKE